MSDKFFIKSRFREYEVRFLDDLTGDISRQDTENSFMIIDEKVYELYGGDIRGAFPSERIIPIKAHEESKTLDKCSALLKELISRNIRKNSILIAVGGGVVEDVVAFISTVLFRGIEWVFYPTTLLAQGDSCIGSKSSINFSGYKNLLGSFYPPSFVGIYTGFLNTLASDDIKSGIGEMLHFYLFDGEDKLAIQMMNEYSRLLEHPERIKPYIIRSLNIKKVVIEEDELDKGKRNLFNYGHTFGHAIETVSNYCINHGQAVTMGMDIANYISMKMGYMSEDIFNDMHDMLYKNLPDFKLKAKEMDNYFEALSRDKKNIQNKLGCILSKGPGNMSKKLISLDEDLRGVIKGYFDLG